MFKYISYKRGKGYKEEPRLHYFETEVFDMARARGGDDWVEDRFYINIKERR